MAAAKSAPSSPASGMTHPWLRVEESVRAAALQPRRHVNSQDLIAEAVFGIKNGRETRVDVSLRFG